MVVQTEERGYASQDDTCVGAERSGTFSDNGSDVEIPSFKMDAPFFKVEDGEWSTLMEYRKDYQMYRRGFAQGARGEISEVMEKHILSNADVERQVVKLFSPSDDPETQKVENLVDEAGREFIESQTFSTPHVPELEIAARFHKTQMPTEPVDVEGYFHDLVKNVVEDGIHTSCPQMIGHMTSALPNYCPMLSKLMVLQKHRTFRAKFSMKSIQNRHILVF